MNIYPVRSTTLPKMPADLSHPLNEDLKQFNTRKRSLGLPLDPWVVVPKDVPDVDYQIGAYAWNHMTSVERMDWMTQRGIIGN